MINDAYLISDLKHGNESVIGQRARCFFGEYGVVHHKCDWERNWCIIPDSYSDFLELIISQEGRRIQVAEPDTRFKVEEIEAKGFIED